MRPYVRLSGALLAAAMWTLGCMPPPTGPDGATTPHGAETGIPAWAKYVKTAPVDPHAAFEQTAAALARELQSPQFVDFQMPAEQIALAATQSLEAGHRADAAVLLSIASYRYQQQARHVREAESQTPQELWSKTNNSVYFRLVRAEEEVYEHLGFGAELRVLSAWLRGEDALELDAELVRRLGELLRGRATDEETFREAVRERLPTAGDASPETPQGATLARAFLTRLRADTGSKLTLYGAVWMMAATPLPAFQTEALRFAWLPVSPRFCGLIADQLGAHRAAVTAMLTDPNDGTRAAAAIVLGMNPSPDQLPALERMWNTERHPLVRLAVAYSLARHGRRERVRTLVTALDHCTREVCLQAASLLEWLPRDLLADVPEDVPAALAEDPGKIWDMHLFAVAMLQRMSLEHPLSARSRAALFVNSHDRHEELSRVALEAISRDTGLARAEVLARLGAASPDYRPLLARLAQVATAADLPMLTGLMPRFAGTDGPEAAFLVEAAGTVPGPEAEARLLGWFDEYPARRSSIALRLLERRPSSQGALDHIVTGTDGRVRLLVQLVRGAPEGMPTLDLALRAPDPKERLFAARLAGMVGDPRSSEALWTLVNFTDDRYYPADALLRHEAMAALVRIALATHRPPPRPKKTMVLSRQRSATAG